MNTEDQRIKFIITTMGIINNLCDELYEALMDEDFDDLNRIVCDIEEILRDINQTFQDEI
ncbi:MAG: hypothetical protein ACO372_03550 [Methylophilaceae bacterium]